MGKGKSGKKGIGRSKRKPSKLAYNQARRWVRNKVKRVAKQLKKFHGYKPYHLDSEVAGFVEKEIGHQ